MRLIATFAFCAFAIAGHASEEKNRVKYRYMVHELGAPEDVVSAGSSVSSNGKFSAGQAWHDASWSYQAAVFQTGLKRTFILPGGTFSSATDVNANGEVVGYSWNPADGPWQTSYRAFHWKKDLLTPLLGLGTGSTVASAINDAGTIAGWSHAPSGAQHAFTYRDGVLTDLGAWGAIGAEVTSINAGGDLAGTRYHVAEPTQEAVRVMRGKVEPLGHFFPGLNSIAQSINSRGDVVGSAHAPFVPEKEPRIDWAFAVFGNQVHRLTPNLPGWSSAAAAINKHRQIVGGYNRPPEGGGSAFLWEDGKLIDLSSLPEVRAAGWVVLHNAVAINDDGVIVGSGDTTGGRLRGYMLVPLKGR